MKRTRRKKTKTEYLSTHQALRFLKEEYGLTIAVNTLKKWCIELGLGGKIHTRYRINKDKLRRLVDDSLKEETNFED